jgi:hypothetical protein
MNAYFLARRRKTPARTNLQMKKRQYAEDRHGVGQHFAVELLGAT